MRNLNSKKARQRIATLYNIIIVSDREIHEFLFCDKNDGLKEHYIKNEAQYYKTKSEYQEAIIELVEVYGIPHVLYDYVIRERAEEQAA